MTVGRFGGGRSAAGSGVGRSAMLTSGTSALALVAIAAAMLVSSGTPQGLDASRPAPSADLGPLALLSESAAMSRATATQESVEVTSLTTSTEMVTAMPDGTFQAELSPVPVRVLDEQSGQWNPVDNTMVRRDDGSVGPRLGAVPMSFSGGGGAPLATITNEERSLSLSWADDLPEPRLAGSVAVWDDVLPDVDLVARAGAIGFSTFLVIHTPEAAANPAVRQLVFDVDATGVELSENSQGALSAKDESGAEVFSAPQPLAWDSSGAAALNSPATTAEDAAAGAPLTAPLEAAAVQVTTEISNNELTLAAPKSLLQGADVTWPVVVDPSWSGRFENDLRTAWTMVWDNGKEFYNHATEDGRVGFDDWSSDPKKSETFYRFDTTALRGTRVHAASFEHKQYHSPNNACELASYGPAVRVGLTAPFTGSTTWSTRPGFLQSDVTADSKAHGNEKYCPGTTNQEWGMTGQVRTKAADNASTMTVGMKSADASNKNGWRKYTNSGSWPKLKVTFSYYPDEPTGLRIDGAHDRGSRGYWTNDTTPMLRAKVHAPNGGTARGRFELREDGVPKWTQTSTPVANGAEAYVTVPAGQVTSGKTYTFRVWAIADTDPNRGDDPLTVESPTSGALVFSVDTVAPGKPQIKRVTPTCRVSQDCVIELRGSGDMYAFWYGINTDDADVEHNSPYAVSPTGPILRVTVQPQTFGPSWVVARSMDLAGNPSSELALLEDVRVESSAMTDHWPLDGSGADKISATDHGQTLQLPTGATWVDGAKAKNWDGLPLVAGDKALKLNGTSQFAETPNAPVKFKTNQDFSVSAWVSVATAPTSAVAISQEGAGGNLFSLGYSSGAWRFIAKPTSTTTTQVSKTDPVPQGSTPTVMPRWVHLVATYDHQTNLTGGTAKPTLTLWVDGERVGTTEVAALSASTKHLLIGRGSTATGTPTQYWPGAIDDVRTFPGVLDPSQIRRIGTEHRTY
ncbi:MAG: LamG domain-containing protein [Sporichthyaceae bacterium]